MPLTSDKTLQDHPQVSIYARCRLNLGYAKAVRGLPMLAAGVRYYLTRQGPASSNGIESVAYYNPDAPNDEPTIQSFHSPAIADVERGSVEPYAGRNILKISLPPTVRIFQMLRQ